MGLNFGFVHLKKGDNEKKGNNNQVICCCYCPLHVRKERQEQGIKGGSTRKQAQTKRKSKSIRVFNNGEEGLFIWRKTWQWKRMRWGPLPPPPPAHKRGERGVRPHGEALENKCKPKPKPKS